MADEHAGGTAPTGRRVRHRAAPSGARTVRWSRRALVVAVASSVVTVGGTLLVLALSPATQFVWGLYGFGRRSHGVLMSAVVDRADALPLALAAAAVPLVLAAAGHRVAAARQRAGRRPRVEVAGFGAALSVVVAANLAGSFAASAGGACTCDDPVLIAAMAAPQLLLYLGVLVAALGGSLEGRRARRERRAQETPDRPAASS